MNVNIPGIKPLCKNFLNKQKTPMNRKLPYKQRSQVGTTKVNQPFHFSQECKYLVHSLRTLFHPRNHKLSKTSTRSFAGLISSPELQFLMSRERTRKGIKRILILSNGPSCCKVLSERRKHVYLGCKHNMKCRKRF